MPENEVTKKVYYVSEEEYVEPENEEYGIGIEHRSPEYALLTMLEQMPEYEWTEKALQGETQRFVVTEQLEVAEGEDNAYKSITFEVRGRMEWDVDEVEAKEDVDDEEE